MTELRSLLPRDTLLWILVVQAAVLLPYALTLPWWVFACWIGVTYWRLQVYLGKWELPGNFVKFVLILGCTAGLILTFKRWYALEPLVTLLAVAFTLKNVELATRRDAFFIVSLAFFVAATHLLFEQGIPQAVYALGCIVLATAALLAMNSPASAAAPRRTLKRAGKMLLQAVPLMLILFIVLPRLGPMWSVPQTGGEASTGLSDSMEPGAFGKLSKSARPAFRVTFADGMAPPAPPERYWRALVFSHFDGRKWTQGHRVDPLLGGKVYWKSRREDIDRSGDARHYQVILEPTRQTWLPALAQPESDTRGVGEKPENLLAYIRPVTKRMAYEVVSWPGSAGIAAGAGLSEVEREINLQLPSRGNERARTLAESWRKDGMDAHEVVQAALGEYYQSFVYTLNPPVLGRDSVDGFLFESRAGFCEHFAGSFVYLMRAAGIPARVVTGYLGGEWIEQQNYMIVHDFDAHAWAEVWLPGEGWTRVDPTAAVAPERVLDGLQNALPEEFRAEDFGLIEFSHIGWLNALRIQWDMLNYRWYRSVVSFDADQQEGLLTRLLGEVSGRRIALALGSVFGIALVVLAAWLHLINRGKPAPRPERLYRRFCQRLARAGLPREKGESPRDYALRICRVAPHWGGMVNSITAAYEKAAYFDDSTAEQQLARLLKTFWPVSRASVQEATS